ncbi:MAG: YraN family protein [Desulfoplanes sp.]|jgi:putative endonuclease|nr:YraN family protein [Desulfoplanes sp.]
MSPRSGTVGRFGEDIACDYLTENDYTILERNWRTRKGELDIICTYGDLLVFVEVKTRGPGSLQLPGEALNAEKKIRLLRAASEYLTKKRLWETASRFDLIALRLREDDVDLEHIQNVIDASEIMGGRHAPWQPW